MAGTSTAFATSAKAEMMQGFHCLAAQVTPTGNTHTNQVVDTLSSISGVGVGMGITGSGFTAGSVISQITGALAVKVDTATSSTLTTTALTISGDVCKMALVKVGPTGTYDATTALYSTLTGNSDEVSGTGYSAGGFAWTAAQLTGIATSGTTAYGQFSTSPSWTTATFSTIGSLTYNTANRLANVTNRNLVVNDFGGTQTVAAGTFTATLPANDNTHALLRAG